MKQKISKNFIWTKRLLLLVGYLCILLLFVGYGSYARYYREITGEIKMPRAQKIQASLKLEEPADISDMLTELHPGTEIKTTEDYKHKLSFSIRNTDLEGNASEVSERPLTYTICLKGSGNIPLEIKLKDAAGNTYTAERTISLEAEDYCVYRFFEGRADKKKEKEFKIASGSVVTQDYTLYFGWDNNDNQYFDNYRRKNDGSFRKEVECLELWTEITADAMSPEYLADPIVSKP